MRGRISAPAAVMLLLAGCSGSPPSGSPPHQPAAARLIAYDGCAELLQDLRGATADRVGPTGLYGAPTLPNDGIWALEKGQLPARAAGPQEHSTTNSHEPGADEPDLVKTDGRRIVAVAKQRLHVIDPATREITHTLRLPGSDRFDHDELLLSGDRALVLTDRTPAVPFDRRPAPGSTGRATRLTLVDLSGAPRIIGTMTSDTGYLDARQNGSTVRVVVRSEPKIDFPGGTDREDAIEENRVEVWKAPLDSWLPRFRLDDGTSYRIPCDQVSRPSAYKGSSVLTVLTVDMGKGLGDAQPIAVTADGSTVYGTGKSLYVTGRPQQPFSPPAKKPAEPDTDIYKFDLSGSGRPRYVAYGSVKGFLLNQYSMSEHDGNLRLATTTDRNGATSQSSAYVLAQHGARLDQIGRIDGLGKGERIHSVRFIGPTGYVVTFRQTDPLYVLDLTGPRRPRRTGELKITGYSAYLHPTADGKLLGVGQDAETSGRTTGLQISLFDVSGAPRRVDAYKLPGATAQVEFDSHAFLYWPKSGLTVVPAARGDGTPAEALALKVTGTSITKVGTVRQPRGGIVRSLVVGDTLWTFSDEGAHAADASTLRKAGWLPYG
ncbi:beta-propeller domain-containing protein [Actinomadura chokoriensis]|uniref:Beta-propeller domain-containing protein n=1 Tax=Actinomadura chokoriensis TaxID=454156 RepID=A0ABV4R2H0_9ACTN